ncbi:DUF1552 domain-containing protein [Aliikangiella coralliicola]|uniref:DUF1552 domain-containing protein n=1 Tax=Aliikangiella coralliicola TaxID=2592383 RepID=A0A545UCE7_9GAMM|nr:DUF1552 domain-containing protein [Aliikangiella coralliicola]TQV87139.1 DUF1552 domain-containing protein [Aliikangiella coralliicola]
MNMTRRKFLNSVLATSIATPLSMTGMMRMAMASGTPKLKVVFAVMPDGFGVDSFAGFDDGLWYPKTDEVDTTSFLMNEMSQHLGDYYKQSLFLRGFILGSGTGGHNGWKTILRDSNSSMTSIDNIIGNAIPGNTPALKRLYSGPHSMVGVQWNVSYKDNTLLLPEDNPYQLFEQIYGADGSGEGPANKAHVFDPVKEDIKELRSKLGLSERNKLNTHLDAVEQVAQELRDSVPIEGCSPASAKPEEGMAITSPDFRQEVTQAHASILASALSCGSSRVATYQIGRSSDQVVIKSVSPTRNPHDCSHRYGSAEEWKGSRIWYVKQVRHLLDRLAFYPDPDVPGDSLLDHTLVIFTSEMADGAPEHMVDLPITMIGGASGLLKNGNGTGRYFDLREQGERNHWRLGKLVDVQRVWATVAKAVGTTVPYGGNVSTLNNIFTNV